MTKEWRKTMRLIKNKINFYVFLLMVFSTPLLAQDECFSCNTIKVVSTLIMEKTINIQDGG
ncbi:hypothetical protein [Yersinia intermedia]|uniref:hypothetical protein n=1 Tax=Yersinia intermedia TaxID=631 RepID=UPI001643F3FA|nr:hypothetical protein [Yersinia intermedia]